MTNVRDKTKTGGSQAEAVKLRPGAYCVVEQRRHLKGYIVRNADGGQIAVGMSEAEAWRNAYLVVTGQFKGYQ